MNKKNAQNFYANTQTYFNFRVYTHVQGYNVSQGLNLIHEENVGRDKLLPPQDNSAREGRFTPDASA